MCGHVVWWVFVKFKKKNMYACRSGRLTFVASLVMLWVMLIVWLAQGQPIYASMSPDQHIAYISDVGMFIPGKGVEALANSPL
jgi:Frag1/DRAM/Sfk1 family